MSRAAARRIKELEAEVAQCRAALAEKDRLIVELIAQVKALQDKVNDLVERLRQNSQNSSKPPSTDGPDAPARRKRPPSGRPPGGQPGHRGHHRQLLPVEQVNEVRELIPATCPRCQRKLGGRDPAPLRVQTTELLPIKPYVTEWQQHRLVCECGEAVTEPLPAEAKLGFGPRLVAMMGLLTGCYRLSKRDAVSLLSDVTGVVLSTGGLSGSEERVSEAVAQPVQEAKAWVQRQPSAHMDETGWFQKCKRAWLWVMTHGAVAVFLVNWRRSQAVAKDLLGQFTGVVVSDRAKAYNIVSGKRHQFCWAHLLRDFEAMAQRKGECHRIGAQLLEQGREVLHRYHQVRDGTLDPGWFHTYMAMARRQIGALLLEGIKCAGHKTAATCREMLRREDSLWTFVHHQGVEPTNNAAERALRRGVLWRRGSFGTQSERGSRFAERILTVVASLKLQRRNVLEYLTEAVTRHQRGLPPPTLLPVSPPQTAAVAA